VNSRGGYQGYDAVIYFILTSLRAVAMGLAVTVALDVLPGRLRTRLITHWVIVGLWVIAVIWANLALRDQVGLHPRVANVVVQVYLLVLLALHMYRGPWTDARDQGRASKVLKAIRELERQKYQRR
jgi:hypothetical protein